MAIGLFLGRFQPLHNGHLAAIREVAPQVDKLYIGIGSANESGTERNPFTVEQREEMVRAVTRELPIVEIVKVPDFPGRDDLWMEYIREHLPELDVVFTGNPTVRELFESGGYKVVGIQMIEGVSGTEIRGLMKSGGDWQSMVPEQVAEILV